MDDKIPKAPKGLGPEARKYWREVNEKWKLSSDSLEILRNACFSLSRMYECRELVDETGSVIKTGSTVRQNPAAQLEIQHRKDFLNCVKLMKLGKDKTAGRPAEGAWTK